MIIRIQSERVAVVRVGGGLLQRGGGAISAISLDGGTASSGASMQINDSLDNTGDDIWALRAPQYGSASITFTKPLPFATGLYLDMSPSGASSVKVSIAYE